MDGGKILSGTSTFRAGIAAAGLAAVAMFAVPSATATALEVKNPVERMAIRARIVQSEMMVAALTCGLRGQYNAVVTEFRTELVGHGRVLRSMFNRQHGAGGQKALDRFVTKLANDASIRSNHARSAYCANARRSFADVLSRRVRLVDTGVHAVQEAASGPTVR